jgi:hypothetical protein
VPKVLWSRLRGKARMDLSPAQATQLRLTGQIWCHERRHEDHGLIEGGERRLRCTERSCIARVDRSTGSLPSSVSTSCGHGRLAALRWLGDISASVGGRGGGALLLFVVAWRNGPTETAGLTGLEPCGHFPGSGKALEGDLRSRQLNLPTFFESSAATTAVLSSACSSSRTLPMSSRST